MCGTSFLITILARFAIFPMSLSITILQVLGLVWAVSFSVAMGRHTLLAASILGHVVLSAAVAVTAATFTVAAKRPKLFMRGAGRRRDGEHD
jgi:hypothetical protein